MDVRLLTAILVGKSIGFFAKLSGSGATAAPGLYALKIDPNLVKKISKNIKGGNIVITGTNGKTTTSRLACDILSAKFKVVSNRQGSNLLRGIASTLISQASISGKIKNDLGIWEADEAALPEIIQNTKPKTILLLNLFRDQLDRYGEVDSTREKWQKSLTTLARDTTILANADDPQIGFISRNFKGKVTYFGINETKLNLPEISHVADIKHCLNCGAKLQYQIVYSSHLGHYSCPNCHLTRPKPQIFATNLKFKSDFSTSININQQFTINYQLPGLYNVYNSLAATTTALHCKISSKIIKNKFSNFSAVFGRSEAITIQGKKARIFLIKNPTGANEVLRVLTSQEKINLLIALNDNLADGRDVSWIWDTNWEILANIPNSVSISGLRAWDMATRLKYAGFRLSKNLIDSNINYSLNFTVKNMNPKDTLIILPTYTALLEIKKVLSKSENNLKWHEN